MPSRLVSKAPQCMSCIRRMTSLGDTFSSPLGQQIRGKKKLAKVSTVNVQLLQNIPGYGKKGSVVPVIAGMMRNIWLPRKMAEYATSSRLQELGKEDVVVERDYTFLPNKQRKSIKAAQALARAQTAAEAALPQEAPAISNEDLPFLSPDAATNIISKLLPANIDFYRTPIATEQHKSQPPKRLSPSIPAASAISAAAAEGQPKEVEAKEPGKTSIYGSVSTSDIAANIKAVLAENNEGARVVLSSEHISFVEEMEDQDRVKHLGVFEIDIRLPGAANAVRRTITVSAQE